MSIRPSFSIPVGSMELTIPPGRQPVPQLLWGNMALATLMLDQGYEDVALCTLEKLQGWLDPTRAEDLAFPGEGRGKGRLLADGVEPGDAGLSWYVIQAAGRQEVRAEAELVEAGFPVYLPRMAYWRRSRRNKIRVEQALLGGYLFVGARSRAVDPKGHDDDVNLIGSLEHVQGIVRFAVGSPYKPAPFSEIRRILQQELDGDFDKTRSKKRFEPAKDEAVRVTEGSFQGFPAKFDEWLEGDRVRLLQHMFGRWVPMTYDADAIEPIA